MLDQTASLDSDWLIQFEIALSALSFHMIDWLLEFY